LSTPPLPTLKGGEKTMFEESENWDEEEDWDEEVEEE
jgi:hypothetical protein